MPPHLEDAAVRVEQHRPLAPVTVTASEDDIKASGGARQPLVWSNILLLAAFHVLALFGVLAGGISWRTGLFSYGYAHFAGLGVTAGVHRLWSHRSYRASRPLRYALALCFSVAGQNTIPNWVRDHRVHHKFTETDADPHDARRGFFFAHVGWLLMRKHPEVYRQGAKVDLSDVLADPVVQWHTRNFLWLKLFLCWGLPTLVPVYFWGERYHAALLATIVRVVYSVNMNWLVNSAAHIYGTHPYDDRINPTDNALVSFLALGEGWHNYHHIFPWDYKAAELKYHLNLTGLLLDVCGRLGLAYDFKTAAPDLVARVVRKHGDGSHPTARASRADATADTDPAAAAHLHELPWEEYVRIAEEYDAGTGVRTLNNTEDLTRMRSR